jgi:primosomal protein N' (replication factor Y)
MSPGHVARVAFDSPLPQLDRLFDYQIPTDLVGKVQVGQLVQVPFGRSAKVRQGYVIEITSASDFSGELSQVLALVSPRVLVTPSIIKLCQSLASRQALSFGEILKVACPDRMVRIDKTWANEEAVSELTATHDHEAGSTEQLLSLSVMPGFTSHNGVTESRWLHEIERIAHATLVQKKSIIVCVPDFRDVARIKQVCEKLGLGAFVNAYETAATKSEQFARHLRALDSRPQIVVGSRNSLYSPLANLGAIVIWDEGDEGHQDEGSPYLHSRDVALVRQTIEDCQLVFLQHAKSSAIKRLENISYLKVLEQQQARPHIAFSSDGFRIDSLAHRTIKDALRTGAVLVQVATKGSSTSIRCSGCNKRSVCSFCSGPLWENSKGQIVCRVCSGFNLQPQCRDCKSQKTKRGRAGTSRTLQEFGKSFPGVRLIEATGEDSFAYLKAQAALVVSTAGAEPICESGYAAVVVLDADLELSRDQLDATEQAVRRWANAISLLAPGGKAVVIGVSPELGQILSLWQIDELTAKLLRERIELGFPPNVRLLSVTGSRENIQPVRTAIESVDGVRILGISAVDSSNDHRLLATYPYSTGGQVAKLLRSAAVDGVVNKRFTKSGRAQRPLTIKMDDAKVL